MKALSIWPEYAMEIAEGKKTEEYRSWNTNYRGPLLICSTKAHGVPGSIPAHAICVVDLVDIREDGYKDYAWLLDNVRKIKPISVKGKLSLFEVDVEPEYCPKNVSQEKIDLWLKENFDSRRIASRTKSSSKTSLNNNNSQNEEEYELSENSLRTMRLLFGEDYKP